MPLAGETGHRAKPRQYHFPKVIAITRVSLDFRSGIIQVMSEETLTYRTYCIEHGIDRWYQNLPRIYVVPGDIDRNKLPVRRVLVGMHIKRVTIGINNAVNGVPLVEQPAYCPLLIVERHIIDTVRVESVGHVYNEKSAVVCDSAIRIPRCVIRNLVNQLIFILRFTEPVVINGNLLIVVGRSVLDHRVTAVVIPLVVDRPGDWRELGACNDVRIVLATFHIANPPVFPVAAAF